MIILGKNTDDKGKQLEIITHNLLSAKGYINITTNQISTGGHEIDVVADYIYPSVSGTDSRRMICECKAHKSKIAIDDWLKFLGKFFCEQEELHTEISGCFIALSGVNGNVIGNYDKLKLKRKNIELVAGDTLLRELKSLYDLAEKKDLSQIISSLTNNNIERLEIAYYQKRLYSVVIFEKKGLYTILDNLGNLLVESEMKKISPMIKKELKLKEFLNLENEAKANRRSHLSQKSIVAAVIIGSGKIKIDSLENLHTLKELKISSVEINKLIGFLVENKLLSLSKDNTEIFINKKAKGFYSKLVKIYRLLLSGELTIEAFEAIKSNYYLNSINDSLFSEIQEIQGGLLLSKEDSEKAIKLFKWFPSALAWALNPDEALTNANREGGLYKAELDFESIIRNDFFQKIVSLGLRDLGYEPPRIYLKEIHGIDTFSSANKIIFKNDSKVEETIIINEMKKIGVLADGYFSMDGSKYVMMLGHYTEESE